MKSFRRKGNIEKENFESTVYVAISHTELSVLAALNLCKRLIKVLKVLLGVERKHV